MLLTNRQYAHRIIECLEIIELTRYEHPDVNPVECWNRVRSMCAGRPLESLNVCTLRLLYSMFDNMLSR